MREKDYAFISKEMTDQIDQVLDRFVSREGDMNADALFEHVTELLPIQKMDFDTVRRRIEGYFYLTETIWDRLLATGSVTRQDIVKRAQLKSLSHYHYLTGSREPANMLQTRDDYLNDPSTSLVKLRDDILGLARIIPDILTESPAVS